MSRGMTKWTDRGMMAERNAAPRQCGITLVGLVVIHGTRSFVARLFCVALAYLLVFHRTERNPCMKWHPLRVERERRGWSQARVAEALGVSARMVTRWELRLAVPYPYYHEQLAQLFGKSVRELGLLPAEQQPENQPDLTPEPGLVLATA